MPVNVGESSKLMIIKNQECRSSGRESLYECERGYNLNLGRAS